MANAMCCIKTQVVHSDMELQDLPHPPSPPAQPVIECSSLQTVEHVLWCRRKWKHSLEGHLTKKELQMFQTHSKTVVYKLLTGTVFSPLYQIHWEKNFCCIIVSS